MVEQNEAVRILVSVVIPAYNEEKYLGDCLASLQKQRFAPTRFEVIVVDNGSSDATAQIVRNFGAVVLYEPQKGSVFARQRGFLHASGEIVAFTDADSVCPPDWISQVYSTFAGDPALIAFTGSIRAYNGNWLLRFWEHYVNDVWIAATKLIKRPIFNGQNFAVRKEAMLTIGGFNKPLKSGEEYDIAIRIGRAGKIAFCPKVIVFTSTRRAKEGYLKILRHVIRDYANVAFLGKDGDGFADVR
jgi:glycosyltransferase involved in cell wall biosynthesis